MVALTEEKIDVLAEVTNIGMGQAAAALSDLLGAFVQLTVPSVRLIAVGDLPAVLAELPTEGQPVTCAVQPFGGGLRGEVLVILAGGRLETMAAHLGLEAGDLATGAAGAAVVLDVASMLNGACLAAIGDQLGLDPQLSAPRLLFENGTDASFHTVLAAHEDSDWSRALLLRVKFCIEADAFCCHLLILVDDAGFDAIDDALERLMNE